MLALALLATTLLLVPPARARDRDDGSIHLNTGSSIEAPARWAPRRDTRLARYQITSQDGDITLLLTPTAVAFQLSDRTMRRIERELRDEQHSDEDNALGEAVKSVVVAGVRVLLKHSAECPVRELRDVGYHAGRLEFVSRTGDRVFDGLEMNDRDLAEAFPEREAQAFVREFRRLKLRER